MAKSAITELSTLVNQLQREREKHVVAIAEVDGVFARYGVRAGEPAKRGRRPGRPKKSTAGVGTKRRKRGNFSTTASDLVLSAIKKAGAKGATGAELSHAWRAAGRPGDAYNTLTLLTKTKQIKRRQAEGERGSRSTLR